MHELRKLDKLVRFQYGTPSPKPTIMPDSDNAKAIQAQMKKYGTFESPDLRGPKVYDLSHEISLNGEDPAASNCNDVCMDATD